MPLKDAGAATVSRRSLLVHSAKLPIAAGVGAAALGYAAPAHAWIPAAATVVQMGVQLHGLMRKPGPGLAQLLSVQTRMLIEIAQQVGVLNQKVDMLMRQVAELRTIVEQLPSETSRAVWSGRLRGVLGACSELLRAYDLRASRNGRVAALASIGPRLQPHLSELAVVRSTLAADPSPLVIPLICTAWYVELRLHFLLLSPGEVVRAMAEGYRAGLIRRTLPGAPESLIDSLSALKSVMVERYVIPGAQEVSETQAEAVGAQRLRARESFRCARGVETRRRERELSSGGYQNRETRYEVTWRGRADVVSVNRLPPEADPPQAEENGIARVSISALENIGVEVDPLFATDTWPSYQNSVRRDEYDDRAVDYNGFREDPRAWTQYVRRVRAIEACGAGLQSPESMRSSAAERRADLELIRAKAFTAYAMLAACRETLRGIDWLLERPGLNAA